MQIKVVTTEKKLTKAMIRQMRVALSADILREGRVLGYVIAIIKDCSKVFIIEFAGDYFTLPANYKKGKRSVYRKIGNWSSQVDLKSEEKCNEWWGHYTRILKQDAPHIYI